ncbi:hypothetical protein E2C01_040305 [Portunus trituberculatus]|uniref:Uncharacterized protein n=1 Tax=Portunus trituberculatus TaxID=210409 RepID=A0A5B7FJC4_PORTR|nr:hypothetical protein [Portunus trituberculatus]
MCLADIRRWRGSLLRLIIGPGAGLRTRLSVHAVNGPRRRSGATRVSCLWVTESPQASRVGSSSSLRFGVNFSLVLKVTRRRHARWEPRTGMGWELGRHGGVTGGIGVVMGKDEIQGEGGSPQGTQSTLTEFITCMVAAKDQNKPRQFSGEARVSCCCLSACGQIIKRMF